MRRKTKAKRILDYENEEQDEKEDQKLDEFYHGLQKRRKQMDAGKERLEEETAAAAAAAAGLQKFHTRKEQQQRCGAELVRGRAGGSHAGFLMENNRSKSMAQRASLPLSTSCINSFLDTLYYEGCGFDCSPTDSFDEGHPSAEEAEYLQSYSKMELIAMVLCMQREMESLKEQLRCLTACGKLAKNLETLIERTQTCPNGDKKTPLPVSSSPLNELVEVDALMPAAPYASGVMNGRWVKQETLTQKSNEVSQRNNLFTEFITPELLERCNTGTTAQKLTNDLLRGLYERDCLASHSISGVVYNKRGQPKPALPTEEVQAILRTVQYFFPGKTDAEIKGYIRQKLQNEAKRLRKKPPLSGSEPRALSLSNPRSSNHQLDLSGQK